MNSSPAPVVTELSLKGAARAQQVPLTPLSKLLFALATAGFLLEAAPRLSLSADPSALNAVLIWFVVVVGGSLFVREFREVCASGWVLLVPLGLFKALSVAVQSVAFLPQGPILGAEFVGPFHAEAAPGDVSLRGSGMGTVWTLFEVATYGLAVAWTTSLIVSRARGWFTGDLASELRSSSVQLLRCWMAMLAGWVTLSTVAALAVFVVTSSSTDPAPIGATILVFLSVVLIFNLLTVCVLPGVVFFRDESWFMAMRISIRTAVRNGGDLFPLVLFQVLALGAIVYLHRHGWNEGSWHHATELRTDFLWAGGYAHDSAWLTSIERVYGTAGAGWLASLGGLVLIALSIAIKLRVIRLLLAGPNAAHQARRGHEKGQRP